MSRAISSARPRTNDAGYSTHGGQSSAAAARCTASHRAAVRLGCALELQNMATPADQRLLELLEKWLESLELHAKYSSLDDDSYWKVQPWVEHQRPSRWIIDLAMQKTIALRGPCPRARESRGTTKYSDSLELMIFLANLVGSEHIERFIPVADAQNERSLTPPAAATMPPAHRPRYGHGDGRGHRHGHPGNAEIPRRQAHAARRGHRAGRAHRTQGCGAGQTRRKAREQAAGEARGRGKTGAPQGGRQARTEAARVRPRRALGCRARAGRRGRGALGAMGTQMVRIAGTHRAHGGSAVACPRCGAYSRKINRPSIRRPGAHAG